MFNGSSVIQTMSETDLSSTRSCRNSDKERGVQKPIIRIILRITSLKKERSIEPIFGKKFWEDLMIQCCLRIHKHGNSTIKKDGPDMKWCWTCIQILLRPEFFLYQKILSLEKSGLLLFVSTVEAALRMNSLKETQIIIMMRRQGLLTRDLLSTLLKIHT